MGFTEPIYHRVGWPIPAIRIEVSSPLAATILLVDLFRLALVRAPWGHVWELVFDQLPIEGKKFKRRAPTLRPEDLTPIDQARRLDDLDPRFPLWDLPLIDQFVWQEIVAAIRDPNRPVGPDGMYLWGEIRRRLFPHIRLDGKWGWAFTGISIEAKGPLREAAADENNRVHRSDGPAVEYPDGFGLYLWHGVRVAKHVVESPSTITLTQIEAAENVEVRRVLIERYGPARYVVDSGAVELSKDRFGRLLRKEVPGDEPILIVEVINSTPEPDGSSKIYHLRVPPTTQTAHEGIAWTFGMAVSEYDPGFES